MSTSEASRVSIFGGNHFRLGPLRLLINVLTAADSEAHWRPTATRAWPGLLRQLASLLTVEAPA
jgi:hypothetical protein